MFLAIFKLTCLHFSIQILALEVHSFKPLRYTCESNNWYKLWKPIKLGIFLILQDLKLKRLWVFFYQTKETAWIFLSQINASRMAVLGYVFRIRYKLSKLVSMSKRYKACPLLLTLDTEGLMTLLILFKYIGLAQHCQIFQIWYWVWKFCSSPRFYFEEK